MSGTFRRRRRPRVAAVPASGPTRRILISPQKLSATGSLLTVQQIPSVTILSPSIRRHLPHVVNIRGHCGSRWGDRAHRPQPEAGSEISADRGRRRERRMDSAAPRQSPGLIDSTTFAVRLTPDDILANLVAATEFEP